MWNSIPIRGKVRDVYYSSRDDSDKVLLVATNRISAFDQSWGEVEGKGVVLNYISQWWFRQLEKEKWANEIRLKSHYLEQSGDRGMICRRCEVIPIEFVVRRYLTGSSSTSILTHYKKGERNYCGHSLPDGLKDHQKLPHDIVTPTTKGDKDIPTTGEEIVEKAILTRDEWKWCEQASLELFKWGARISHQKGLILVDTKYEFGRDTNTGEIILIDELHTPDSSRFWIESSYQERIDQGNTPDNLNKEFLRLWIKSNKHSLSDTLPNEVIQEVKNRYQTFLKLFV